MKKLLLLIITMQITLFAQTPAPYIPINSGDVVEDHVNYLEKKYYQLELSNTQTADIQLTDLDADIDLYVAINRKAAIRDNDCYSSNGGTTYEKCVLSSTAPEGKENSIIILVYGFKASNYKLKISTREGGESITEISETPLSGHLKQGESAQYKFLGKKGKTYTTTLSALSADADLRVKIGKKAGLHSFDCKSTNGGTKTDECSVTLTKDATVFVHVNGYRTADYKISVTKNTKNSPITLAKLKEMIKNHEDISKVNTSEITDMSRLFPIEFGTSDFNYDISNWDVSNVKDMSFMFDTSHFNGNIANWDVSNVTNMLGMFEYAVDFNSDISNWDVSNVRNMKVMFDSALSFNQDISNWDVSNVRNMIGMFESKDDCSNFNQNIEKWNVSKVIYMDVMLPRNRDCYGLNNPFKNHDLSVWDVSSVQSHDGFMEFGARDNNITEPKWVK